MAITGIEMTGANADLFAVITPKNNVTLGIKKNNGMLSGTILKKEAFLTENGIHLPEDFVANLKNFKLEKRFEIMINYLKKLLVK